MADIISLDAKLDQAQNRRGENLARQKARIVRSVLRQTQDSRTCEKCTGTLDPADDAVPAHKIQIPYRLCASCAGEYADFIARLQGDGEPERYWQNRVWLETWKRWIDYRGSMHSFMASKEFRKLVEEIQTTGPTS